MDIIDQQKRVADKLVHLLREECQCLPSEVPEIRQNLEEQLRFMKHEKKRIQLRASFVEKARDDLASAQHALDDALDLALSVLSSNDIKEG